MQCFSQTDANGPDPRDYLLRTWPWPEDVPGLPRALEPVHPGSGENLEIVDREESQKEAIGERVKPDGAEDPLVIFFLLVIQLNFILMC